MQQYRAGVLSCSSCCSVGSVVFGGAVTATLDYLPTVGRLLNDCSTLYISSSTQNAVYNTRHAAHNTLRATDSTHVTQYTQHTPHCKQYITHITVAGAHLINSAMVIVSRPSFSYCVLFPSGVFIRIKLGIVTRQLILTT